MCKEGKTNLGRKKISTRKNGCTKVKTQWKNTKSTNYTNTNLRKKTFTKVQIRKGENTKSTNKCKKYFFKWQKVKT